MHKIVLILASVLLVALFIAIICPNAQEDQNGVQWPSFARWYEWKKQTNLNEEQKKVINYLDITLETFNKADSTRSVHVNSKYGIFDPKDGVLIVQDSIAALKKLPCPQECTEYRDVCIAILNNILDYHRLRITYNTRPEEFEKKYEDYILSSLVNDLDGKQMNLYFDAMKKVGLFDNIDEEMKAFD